MCVVLPFMLDIAIKVVSVCGYNLCSLCIKWFVFYRLAGRREQYPDVMAIDSPFCCDIFGGEGSVYRRTFLLSAFSALPLFCVACLFVVFIFQFRYILASWLSVFLFDWL